MTTIYRTSVLQNLRFSPGKRLVTGFMLGLYLVVAAPVQALDLLKPFSKLFGGDDGIVIWKGPGQFVKVVDQDWDHDHRRAPENSHPVQLKPEELAIVLASIQAPDPEGTAIVPVFTREEIQVLAEHLPVALDRSQQDQDVVFGVVDNHSNVASTSRRSTGCRVFYQGGELNMIFGDVLQPTDSSDDGTSEYSKPHRAGRRMESNGREIRVATGPGIIHWQGRGILRRDWIMIDMHSTIAAYRGPQPLIITKTADVSAGQRQPVANYGLSAENRRLREDLARARQRMSQEQQDTVSGGYNDVQSAPVTPAPVMRSSAIEDRNNDSTRENRKLREDLARARQRMSQEQQDTVSGDYNAIQNTPVTPAPVMRSSTIASTSTSTTNSSGSSGDIVQRLTTLKALYDKQLITGAEYDAKRKEILEKF